MFLRSFFLDTELCSPSLGVFGADEKDSVIAREVDSESEREVCNLPFSQLHTILLQSCYCTFNVWFLPYDCAVLFTEYLNSQIFM